MKIEELDGKYVIGDYGIYGENIGDYDIPIHNAIIIPKVATNGDMIKAMFGCTVIEISNGKVYVEHIYFPFDEEWWNEPYKKVEVKE